jgi:hypothetical protein
MVSELVSAITGRVLLGAEASNDDVSEWVQLVYAAEPERAFSSPLASIGTLMDVAIHGERKIFERIRQHVYPFLDKEIERCIAGEPETHDASVISGKQEQRPRNESGFSTVLSTHCDSLLLFSAMVRMWFSFKLKEDPDYLRATPHQIANDLLMLTFAAVANSYGAAAWVLFHAIRNTNGVGSRIREELGTLGQDSDSFPELEKTIYEIARLYVPGTLMRVLQKDWELPSKGIIPSGSVVACSVFCAHRNLDGFSNPLEFDPERFSEDRDERKKRALCSCPLWQAPIPASAVGSLCLRRPSLSRRP